jgi:hypothetical protein
VAPIAATQRLRPALVSLIYEALIWPLTERREEIEKKYPISGEELRRRKKAFFDWLATQQESRPKRSSANF